MKQRAKRIKTICFDIDGCLCSQTKGDYENAIPNMGAIRLVNQLYDAGHSIILHTSRFMGRAHNNPAKARKMGLGFTRKQLASWGVLYHRLWFGKPRYDIVIDDRSLFFKNNWKEIKKELNIYILSKSDF
jgi:hypothetical protein